MIPLLVWSCLCVCIYCQTPTLYISEPQPEALFALKDNVRVISIPVSFQIFDRGVKPDIGESGRLKMCIRVKVQPSGEDFVTESCVDEDSNTLQITRIPAGSYTFHFCLKSTAGDMIPFSSLVSTVTVKRFTDLLPKLSWALDDNAGAFAAGDAIPTLTFVSDDKARVTLRYTTSSEAMPLANFQACFRATHYGDHDDQDIMPLTCTDIEKRAVTLSNLEAGREYSVYLSLRAAASPFTHYKAETETVIRVRILRLEQALPSLKMVPDGRREFGISDADSIVSIPFSFAVEGHHAALDQVQVCLHADKTVVSDGGQTMMLQYVPFTCLQREQTEISLPRVTMGNYTLHALLRMASPPHKSFDVTAVRSDMRVEVMREFIASYDWQPLHAWHTIPAGLVTRLPLSSISSVKEAKIPEPWNLQVMVPFTCKAHDDDKHSKSFIRMDVHRHTTIASLREHVAQTCHVIADCIYFTADDEQLHDHHDDAHGHGHGDGLVTAASASLFHKKVKLHRHEVCDAAQAAEPPDEHILAADKQ